MVLSGIINIKVTLKYSLVGVNWTINLPETSVAVLDIASISEVPGCDVELTGTRRNGSNSRTNINSD